MECSYGDACEHLHVALVPCKNCDMELHYIYQAKFEHDYGIVSNMVYTCRPCIDKRYHGVIESAKEADDDEIDSDNTVDLSGGNNSNNKATANAFEVGNSGDQGVSDVVGEIDGANGGAAALETNDDNIKGQATKKCK